MRQKKQKNTEGAVATMDQATPVRKKKKSKKKIVLIVVLVLIVGFIGYRMLFGGGKQQTPTTAYVEETVQTRDIITTLTGKGTLQPADSYTVTSLLKGEIKQAEFEEGDKVTKDTVLYVIDSSDASTSVERAQNALANAQRSYAQAQESLADLSVKANASGQVINLDVKVGDKINAGQTIATIRDSQTVTVKLPFPADEAKLFYVGQSASVTLDGSFETLGGRVTEISAADEVLSGNRIVRNVTIEVTNPGAITATTQATATVGSSACAASGTFTYKAEKAVTAEASGDVVSINVSEGQSVSINQTILTLSSSQITNSVETARSAVADAQLSLDSQGDALDDYTIKSPIDGTVIEKAYKQGDNMESGKVLCIIYDLDYLEFTMNIDELDINNVAVGQKVSITADAAAGQVFEGVVTKVSINGTTSGGVTAYPVTVRVDASEGLLPGMNVDASIIISESVGVLSVPVEALKRGNKILVKTGTDKDAPVETGVPAGYTWVDVTTGNSDGSFIEITSGVDDGAQIAYEQTTAPSSDPFAMMMGGEATTVTMEPAEPPAGGGEGGHGPGGTQ